MANEQSLVLEEPYDVGVYPDAACTAWMRVVQGSVRVVVQIDGDRDNFDLYQGGGWKLGDARFGVEAVRIEPIGETAIVDLAVGRNVGEFVPPVSLDSPPVHQGPVDVSESGAIAAANASEQILERNLERRYFTLQNIDAATDLWIRYGATAAQIGEPGSFKLGPYDFATMEASFIATSEIQGISSKAGHKYTIIEG